MLVNVIAGRKVGLGHVYNILTVLSYFNNDKILVVMNTRSKLGIDKIRNDEHQVKVFKTQGELLDMVRNYEPNIVINDILDTKAPFVQKLQKMGCFVINFEDLGPGSDYANLVFNPIYFQKSTKSKFFGEKYICIRKEFRKRNARIDRKSIVVTFGGVDPERLTMRLLEIFKMHRPTYKIVVVVGSEFPHKKEVLQKITRLQQVGLDVEKVVEMDSISQFISGAMFAITANGRTVFEVASQCVPIITISANSREELHEFSKRRKIGYHLGLHSQISDEKILQHIKKMELIQNRKKFSRTLQQMNLPKSACIVQKIINTRYMEWLKKKKMQIILQYLQNQKYEVTDLDDSTRLQIKNNLTSKWKYPHK